MDYNYFRKVSNTYLARSKKEAELFLVNRNERRFLYDNIDREKVLKNGEPFELLIIKGTSGYVKKVKSVHNEPFNIGDYIQWGEQWWLVTSLDPDIKTHISGIISLCTIPVYWINPSGVIIKRWGYIEDFTKYDAGTTANGVITIASNQHGITLPIDEETRYLDRENRFVIDYRTESDYEKGFVPDVYQVTNRKTVLSDYRYFGRGGLMTLTLTMDSFDSSVDQYVDVGDGTKAWVCGMNANDTPSTIEDPIGIEFYIQGPDVLYGGYKGRWKAFISSQNNAVSSITKYEWKISADFDTSEVSVSTELNYIYLEVEEAYIGEEITLQLWYKDEIQDEKTIPIVGI